MDRKVAFLRSSHKWNSYLNSVQLIVIINQGYRNRRAMWARVPLVHMYISINKVTVHVQPENFESSKFLGFKVFCLPQKFHPQFFKKSELRNGIQFCYHNEEWYTVLLSHQHFLAPMHDHQTFIDQKMINGHVKYTCTANNKCIEETGYGHTRLAATVY